MSTLHTSSPESGSIATAGAPAVAGAARATGICVPTTTSMIAEDHLSSGDMATPRANRRTLRRLVRTTIVTCAAIAGLAQPAAAIPADDCGDSRWRPDGHFLTHIDSPWLWTATPPIGTRHIQFRVTSGHYYRKYVYDRRSGRCKPVRIANYRATQWRTRHCYGVRRFRTCDEGRFEYYTERTYGRIWDRPYFPGEKYGWDPLLKFFRRWS